MWELTHHHARFTLDNLSAAVTIDRPDAGVRELVAWQHPLEHTLLCLGTSPESEVEAVSDCFVRGTDLVVSYEMTSRRSTCPQVYWRAVAPVEHPGIRGLELILSVQTSLLDSDATLTTTSHLLADEIWRMTDETSHFERFADYGSVEFATGPGLVLFRRSGSPSYAEMIFPSDFSSVQITRNGEVKLTWKLFPERLEKGVIRRGRLRGVFLDPDRDIELAALCYREFVSSPLPLTT